MLGKIILMLCAFNLTSKIVSVDEEQIIAKVPGHKKDSAKMNEYVEKLQQMEKDLKAFIQRITKLFKEKQQELQNKKTDLIQSGKAIKALEKVKKEAEQTVMQKQQAIVQIKTEADKYYTEMKKKEQKYYNKYIKALHALISVAKEKVEMVVSMPTGRVLYVDPANDITAQVSAELDKLNADLDKM